MSVLQSGLTTAPAVVVAVIGFAFLIIVHELGHALAARAVGMRIVRFSVGYGKVLWSFRAGNTEIAFSAIPVGGYVWIGGMIPEDGTDHADPAAWLNQHAWRRTLAIAAGPVASYLGAIFVAAVLFVAIGVPTRAPLVGEIRQGSPAEAAGLKSGDLIVAVGGAPVSDWNGMVMPIQRSPGKPLQLEVQRGEGPGAERLTLTLTPRPEGGVGKAGFGQLPRLEKRPIGQALSDAFTKTNEKMIEQLRGILRAVSGGATTSELSGPLEIGRTLTKGASIGPDVFFSLIWILSVALAVLNLLPLPPLDGGKLVFLLWELATGKRAGEKVELAVSWVGFLLLAALMLGVTIFGDIPRLLR